MAKAQSRLQLWEKAATAAETAIEDLMDLQMEYQEWLDNLPENLQNGVLYEKLEAVCDLDLSEALDVIQAAAGTELPLGFGRD